MSKRIRATIGLVTLLLITVLVIFPSISDAAVYLANGLLKKVGSVLLIIPLLLYAIVGFVVRKYLWKPPRDELVSALDRQEASSLVLTGFCFTSLSFLLAFFKDEIKRGDSTPKGILLFFAVALGCFIASYMAMRYRTKNLFMVLNEAFLDNGLWCVLAGFWEFFNASPSLRALSATVTIFIVIFFLYLIMHFVYWIGYARKIT
jgi:hypothetical protein